MKFKSLDKIEKILIEHGFVLKNGWWELKKQHMTGVFGSKESWEECACGYTESCERMGKPGHVSRDYPFYKYDWYYVNNSMFIPHIFFETMKDKLDVILND